MPHSNSYDFPKPQQENQAPVNSDETRSPADAKTSIPENGRDISALPSQETKALEDSQTASPSPGVNLWAAIATATLLALGIGFFGGQWWQSQGAETGKPATSAPAAPRATSVKVAPVAIARVQDTSEFVGTLDAKRSINVRPEINGRVVEIFVEAGDFVSQGQAIARLESEELQADLRRARANLSRDRSQLAQLQAGPRREAIAAAEARLQRSRSQLAELQAGPRREEVAAADARLDRQRAQLAELQAGSRSEEIAGAKARLQEAEAELADAKSGSLLEEIAQAEASIEARQAELDLAREQVERNRELKEEGAIAEFAFLELEKEARAARARLLEAQKRLTQLQRNRESEVDKLEAALEQQRQVVLRLENGTRPEEIARARAEVAEAQSNFSQLENGTRPEEIARARAEVAEAESELSELLNGTRPEEIATAEAEVAAARAEVESYQAQLNDAEVVAPFSGVIGDVPVKRGEFVNQGETITTLTENQELELRLPISLEKQSRLRLGLLVEIADAEGKSLGTGRITFISPTVSDSQTILAKATIDNRQGQLQDGQFARALVVWEQRQQVVVPMTAVVFEGDRRFVFVAEGEGEASLAKRVPIELGLIKGDRAEVVAGLQPGQQLIVSGIQRLKDGGTIKILP